MLKFTENYNKQKTRSYKFSSLLAVITFGVAIIVSFSVSLVVLYLEHGHLREELKETGIVIAKNLTFSSQEFLLNNDRWNLYKLCRSITEEGTTTIARKKHRVSGIEYAMILNKDGILSAHSDPLNNHVGNPVSTNDILSRNALKSNGLLIQESLSEGHKLFNISFPIPAGPETIGFAMIGISEKGLVILFQSIRNNILLVSLAIALLFGMLAFLLSYWLTSPFTKLSSLANSYNLASPSKNFAQKIKSHIVEIDSLSKIWSGMSNKIQETVKELHDKSQNIMEGKKTLEKMLNGIGAGLVILDKDLKIIWHNEVFDMWFAHKERNRCFERIEIEHICKECPTMKAFSTGKVHFANQARITTEGEKHFKVISVPWKNEQEDITQVFELLLDISDKALLEKKLRNIESDAVIGKLAASMAHEIRNPLSSLVSSINLLHKDADMGLSRIDKKKLIDVINKESNRLSTILEDFLKYGRKRKMKLELCDVNQMLDEIIDIAKYRKDVQNRVYFSKSTNGTLAMIHADKEMLKQAFWNLIVNSMDAIKAEGSINVTISEKNGFLKVLIRDSGRGIPAKLRDHIFEPFQTAKKDGTGLGLTIASKMIAMHLGTIDVTESSKKGTTFLIKLPVSREVTAYHE